MDQDRIAFTEVTGKTPTTLENIPEDVAAIIAESIKSWATVEGNLEQREKARRSRDSALRAVALSCRRSLEIYRPILWQNVTLDLRNFFSFCQALKGDQGYAFSTRFLHFKNAEKISTEERHLIKSQLSSASSLNSKDDMTGIIEMLKVIYGKLACLQSLVIMNKGFIPPSFEQLSSFSTTLKKLFIPLVNHSKLETRVGAPLNARNIIWLLSFGVINETALGITISSQEDFKFLVEHHEHFAGTSKVKKLSLSFEFVFNKFDRKTWWGLPEEKIYGFKNGNKKSETIALLLEVVNNQVQCLELYPSPAEVPSPDDETKFLSLTCLLNLGKSLGTLQHLRLVNCLAEKPSSSPFLLFQSLKTLSLEINFLYSQVKLIKSKLPVSLETIVLTYYLRSENAFKFTEDELLAQLIRSQFLPNLKEIVVPFTAVGPFGKEMMDANLLKLWAQGRRELEKEAVFKSGKVRLTKADRGYSVIPDSQTFMSHLRWLYPPF